MSAPTELPGPVQAPAPVDRRGHRTFHVNPDGETQMMRECRFMTPNPLAPGGRDNPLAVGYFLGLLVGEGHFGGDGRQPHIVLRMHVRHEAIFRWLVWRFPGGRLYGPYCHGGRRYFQWMARGAYLRDVIAPLIRRHEQWLDEHAMDRFENMCARYSLDPGRRRPVSSTAGLAKFRQTVPQEGPPVSDPL